MNGRKRLNQEPEDKPNQRDSELLSGLHSPELRRISEGMSAIAYMLSNVVRISQCSLLVNLLFITFAINKFPLLQNELKFWTLPAAVRQYLIISRRDHVMKVRQSSPVTF